MAQKLGAGATVGLWSMRKSGNKLCNNLCNKFLHTALVIRRQRKNGEKGYVIKIDNGREQGWVRTKKWGENGVKEGVSGHGESEVEVEKFGHFREAG